jgi:hypothetical protein
MNVLQMLFYDITQHRFSLQMFAYQFKKKLPILLSRYLNQISFSMQPKN